MNNFGRKPSVFDFYQIREPDKSEFEGLAKLFVESFDKTFSKVFCDPTATRWSPVATGEIPPLRGPCYREKEAKIWVQST